MYGLRCAHLQIQGARRADWFPNIAVHQKSTEELPKNGVLDSSLRISDSSLDQDQTLALQGPIPL